MIPCCIHPTQVFVIDDDDEMLRHLSQILPKDCASYHYMSGPEAALTYINKSDNPSPFPNRYINNFEEDAWEHRCLDVNISDTYQEIYRPERFEEISTIIVDHSMPEMTGLQLCEKIKDPNIQKILLTGVADEHLAIRAFNDGLIHHYIRKQDLDLEKQLSQAVESAQWRYFNKLSEVTLKAITSVNYLNHAITDPKFQDFFKQIMQKNSFAPSGFTEAYLCEAMGTYLFLTEAGESYGLVVNNEDQIKTWTESANALDATPNLLQELADKAKMIWYHSRDGALEPPGQEWVHYAHTPEIIQGANENYYYILQPNLFDIDKSRVLSFKEYKAKRMQKDCA